MILCLRNKVWIAACCLALAISAPAQDLEPESSAGQFPITPEPQVDIGLTTEGEADEDSGDGGDESEGISSPQEPAASDDPLLRRLNDWRTGAGAAAAEESDAPGAPSVPDLFAGRQFLKMLGVLCVVVAAIIVLLTLARKVGERTPLLASPRLGKVLGRIHLGARGTALHYVQTGDKVLVVGVTPTSISLVTQFDASAFGGEEDESPVDVSDQSQGDFLAHLQASTEAMNQEGDDEIVELRDDVHRLQRYIRDDAREISGD